MPAWHPTFKAHRAGITTSRYDPYHRFPEGISHPTCSLECVQQEKGGAAAQLQVPRYLGKAQQGEEVGSMWDPGGVKRECKVLEGRATGGRNECTDACTFAGRWATTASGGNSSTFAESRLDYPANSRRRKTFRCLHLNVGSILKVPSSTLFSLPSPHTKPADRCTSWV